MAYLFIFVRRWCLWHCLWGWHIFDVNDTSIFIRFLMILLLKFILNDHKIVVLLDLWWRGIITKVLRLIMLSLRKKIFYLDFHLFGLNVKWKSLINDVSLFIDSDRHIIVGMIIIDVIEKEIYFFRAKKSLLLQNRVRIKALDY